MGNSGCCTKEQNNPASELQPHSESRKSHKNMGPMPGLIPITREGSKSSMLDSQNCSNVDARGTMDMSQATSGVRTTGM